MGLFSFLFESEEDVNKYRTNPAAGEKDYFQWKKYDDYKNWQGPVLMKKRLTQGYNYTRKMFYENCNIRKVSTNSNIPNSILEIMQRCLYALEELPITETTENIGDILMTDIAYGEQQFQYSQKSDGTQVLRKSLSGACDTLWKKKITIPEGISLISYPWRIDPEGNWHERYEFHITTGTISCKIVTANLCGNDSQVWWSYRESPSKPVNYLSLFGLNY